MCSAGKHKSHNKDKEADSPAGPRTCTEPTETQKEGDRRRGEGDVLRRKRAAHGGTTITHCSTRADSPDHGTHRTGATRPYRTRYPGDRCLHSRGEEPHTTTCSHSVGVIPCACSRPTAPPSPQVRITGHRRLLAHPKIPNGKGKQILSSRTSGALPCSSLSL